MQTALFNKFDRKFLELERRTGRDPSRIEWLVHNSADIRRLVGTLYFWDAEFRAYRFDNMHLEAPSWFISRYREYSERYSPNIQRVYGRLHLEALDQDQVDGIPAEEIRHPDESPVSDGRFQVFIPAMRDGAESIEFVWRYVHETSDGSTRDESLDEELRRGVEAWDYFTETVGIDLAAIESRWAKLPRALVPSAPPGRGQRSTEGCALRASRQRG